MLSWVEHEKSFITSGPESTYVAKFVEYFENEEFLYMASHK